MDKIIVDLFAGGGGASTGIEKSLNRKVDIAVNHDRDAISMHEVNHPNTTHYIEDIWDVDPLVVTEGKEVLLLWASPDCTHFSKARGGKPKQKNIRSLAWVVVKWARLKKPDVIILENVEEFLTWGPLDENQLPIKDRKGETFQRFINELKSAGYDVEYKVINAADYKTPTTRKRLFIIARCDGKPIVFPKPYVKTINYIPARDIIDWSIPGKSIFEREKPLSENTMKRIWKGLEKHVINNLDPNVYLSSYAKEDENGALITPWVLVNNTGHPGTALDYPISTITSGNHHFLIIPFLVKHYGGSYNGSGLSVNDTLSTVTSIDHHALVSAYLTKYYGKCSEQSKDTPLHTVTAKERLALVTINQTQYQIIDIKMRMLEPRELYKAQGFPDNYVIDKNSIGVTVPRYKQVKLCGNSVCPTVAEALVRANLLDEDVDTQTYYHQMKFDFGSINHQLRK